MTFEPLASSSAGCAYVLTGDGLPPLLIDAGADYKTIARAVRPTSLAAVLVSHSHGDHVRSLPSLLRLGVTVVASEWTLRALDLWGDYRARPIAQGETLDVEGWRVAAFDLVHDARGTIGFVVAGGGGKLVYITDTAYCPVTFQGVTHWAIEANYSRDLARAATLAGRSHVRRYQRVTANHMSIETAIDLLRANDLATAREIHLLHLSDANSDADAFADAVRAATGVPTYIARKG